MKRLIAAFAMMGCLAVSGMVSAAPEWVTPHSCSKPTKPVFMGDELAVSMYQRQVRDYKECIQQFVQDQEDAIRQHRQAASDAIDEWNSFVKYELH